MGFAKSSGQVGCFTVVPGPGVLNAAAALCTAMGNCSPVLCLTGQVPSEYLGRGRGHLHELKDQQATLKSLIKDAFRVDQISLAPRIVAAAIQLARNGRPGPVAVEMCWDTMARAEPIAITPGKAGYANAVPLVTPAIDPGALEAATRAIADSRRPMIVCGAGAQHAATEIKALAERLGAPVTAFRSGRGVVPEDHRLGIGAVAARELWDETDLVIGIGSRLEMPYMRWGNGMRYQATPAGGPAILRIDIDPEEMQRLVPKTAVVGDSADVTRELLSRLEKLDLNAEDRSQQVRAARPLALRLIDRIQPQADYLTVIRRVLPRDGFFVPELSQAGFLSYTGAFPVLEPRTYVTEGFQGTLGFGFPTSLGVKAAHPNRSVVAVTGDGGFMFGMQELATAAQYKLAVVIVLFNNRSFGNVLRDQQQQYGGRIIGAEFQNPDFVRLAESFGVRALRVRSPAELEPALERALGLDEPTLIEVVLERGSETSPWPLIHLQSRPSSLDPGTL
jgi:acetolactate synthase-1/2/3 large subunit